MPLGRSVLTTDGLALGGGGIAGLKIRSACKFANGDSATWRGISLAPRVFVSVVASNDRDSSTPTRREGVLSDSRFFANYPRTGTPALAYIQQMRDDVATGPKMPGFTAIGVFLFFAAVMAGLAATTLLWQGTVLDRAWTLNPTAYKQLAPLGRKVGIPFLLLAVTLITAGIGWFRRHIWGWRLAAIVIATQLLGDVVNCVKGDWLRGGTGVIIAGALLLFLLQPRMRATFA